MESTTPGIGIEVSKMSPFLDFLRHGRSVAEPSCSGGALVGPKLYWEILRCGWIGWATFLLRNKLEMS